MRVALAPQLVLTGSVVAGSERCREGGCLKGLFNRLKLSSPGKEKKMDWREPMQKDSNSDTPMTDNPTGQQVEFDSLAVIAKEATDVTSCSINREEGYKAEWRIRERRQFESMSADRAVRTWVDATSQEVVSVVVGAKEYGIFIPQRDSEALEALEGIELCRHSLTAAVERLYNTEALVSVVGDEVDSPSTITWPQLANDLIMFHKSASENDVNFMNSPKGKKSNIRFQCGSDAVDFKWYTSTKPLPKVQPLLTIFPGKNTGPYVTFVLPVDNEPASSRYLTVRIDQDAYTCKDALMRGLSTLYGHTGGPDFPVYTPVEVEQHITEFVKKTLALKNKDKKAFKPLSKFDKEWKYKELSLETLLNRTTPVISRFTLDTVKGRTLAMCSSGPFKKLKETLVHFVGEAYQRKMKADEISTLGLKGDFQKALDFLPAQMTGFSPVIPFEHQTISLIAELATKKQGESSVAELEPKQQPRAKFMRNRNRNTVKRIDCGGTETSLSWTIYDKGRIAFEHRTGNVIMTLSRHVAILRAYKGDTSLALKGTTTSTKHSAYLVVNMDSGGELPIPITPSQQFSATSCGDSLMSAVANIYPSVLNTTAMTISEFLYDADKYLSTISKINKKDRKLQPRILHAPLALQFRRLSLWQQRKEEPTRPKSTRSTVSVASSVTPYWLRSSEITDTDGSESSHRSRVSTSLDDSPARGNVFDTDSYGYIPMHSSGEQSASPPSISSVEMRKRVAQPPLHQARVSLARPLSLNSLNSFTGSTENLYVLPDSGKIPSWIHSADSALNRRRVPPAVPKRTSSLPTLPLAAPNDEDRRKSMTPDKNSIYERIPDDLVRSLPNYSQARPHIAGKAEAPGEEPPPLPPRNPLQTVKFNGRLTNLPEDTRIAALVLSLPNYSPHSEVLSMEEHTAPLCSTTVKRNGDRSCVESLRDFCATAFAHQEALRKWQAEGQAPGPEAVPPCLQSLQAFEHIAKPYLGQLVHIVTPQHASRSVS
ncbi:hypothetical protein FOL47_011014 [Perkinsus chesapeaki]|uniref:Uncharacterized protein n=1 Tax=Perkinsus chesapeaki TaxID=330153 RepID=A0A7J6MNI6_PERCH|nr:hypothetical protein FOL47_011014 [Perkinsus chesapeaki]